MRIRKRDQMTELQQRKILNAALQQFAQNGYLGTTISAVANEAGISYGLVHHYFKSKELLFLAVLEAGIQLLKSTRASVMDQGNQPEQLLRNLLYLITLSLGKSDVFHQYLKLVMQVIGAPQIHPPQALQVINQYSEEEVRNITSLLNRIGLSEEQSFQLACLAFNTLMGGQMFAKWNEDQLFLLYKAGCDLLGISAEPLPDILLPSFEQGFN